MKHVNVMIGNSSSGIIEAPNSKTPVINIGSRQNGRVLSDNIRQVDEPTKEKILQTIDFVLTNKAFKDRVKKCKNKHGTR